MICHLHRQRFRCLACLACLVCLVCLALVTRSAAAEQEGQEGQGAPTEIGVMVEHIQLGSQAASQLLRGYEGDGSALRAQLQELVERDEAQVLDGSYIRTQAWRRSRIDSVSEFIYPTEYDPPSRPQKISGKVAPGVDLNIPANPTAFDRRLVGNQLDLGVDVYAGEDVLALNVGSRLIEYSGEASYGEGIAKATQPLFDALNNLSQVFIKSGEFALLGVHSPRVAGELERDRSRRIFVMARATILREGSVPPREPDPVVVDDPFSGDAASAKPGCVTQIGVLVEYIQVGTASATKLVRAHAADADARRLRGQIQSLIDAGEAVLVDSAYVLSASGRRAKVESIYEFIHPTEYDPPGLPSSFGQPELVDGLPIIPSPPQAFDVRNVGSSFEVEPGWSASPDRITLNIAPERVCFVDFIHYGQGGALAQQPLFSVMKLQTNLTLPDGAYSLAAVQVPRDESGEAGDPVRVDQTKRILIFIKASLIKVPMTANHDDHE